MALVDFKYFSPALGMQTALTIILPENTQGIGVGGLQEKSDAPIPALYLLHGTSDDQTIWQRRTSIERYVAEKRLAVVMMTTHLGAYTNQQYGFRYFDFVAKEVPEVCARYFNLSRERSGKFVAGLSMGGYGALKIGLTRPEQYGVIGSLSSGYTSYRGYISRPDDRGITLQYLTFGETGLDEEDVETAEKARAIVRSGKNIPRIFITCGSSDPILLDNAREARDFFSSFEGNPFDFQYTEHPGSHNWSFWDAHICDFLRYAGLNPREHFC